MTFPLMLPSVMVLVVFALGAVASRAETSAADQADAATTTWPLITVGILCKSVCSGLPAVFNGDCAKCLLKVKTGGFGSSIPTWTGTSQPTLQPRLPRMPLYEAGYTNIPALTLLYPSLWADPSQPLSTCVLLKQERAYSLKFPSNVFLAFGGLPTNVTICAPQNPLNCTTLNFGNTYDVKPDSIHPGDTVSTLMDACCQCTPTADEVSSVSILVFSCMRTVGWLGAVKGISQRAPFGMCPLPTLFDRLAGDSGIPEPFVELATSFNTPQQIAMGYTSNSKQGDKFAAFGEQAQAEAVQFYTNVTAAADSLWLIMHNAYAATLFMRKPAPSEAARLQAQFGADWKYYSAALSNGTLYEMDLATWQQQFSFNLDPTSPVVAGTAGWNIGAHVLFQRIQLAPTEITMRVIAVRLTGQYHSNASAVFTVAKSPSAFILAMAGARASYMAMVIWIGHVYTYHVLQGAASYAIFNAIEPGVPVGAATHPVRLLLDTYVDPFYLSGFNGALFGTIVPQPPTAVPLYTLPQLFNIYAVQGPLGVVNNTLWSTLPAQALKLANLNVSEFTSVGGQPWDLYPLASFQLQGLALCSAFALKVVNLYYATDAAVAADARVQAMASGLVDPLGANLRQFNANNTIQTRQNMADLAGALIYASVAHGTSHLQDYAIRALSMAHLAPRTELAGVPSPTQNYTMQDLITAAPHISTYSNEYFFISAFIGTEPWAQVAELDASGAIDWTLNLPFPTTTIVGKAANAETVRFRKALSVLLDAKHDKYIKATNTNFGPTITRMSPVIDI